MEETENCKIETPSNFTDKRELFPFVNKHLKLYALNKLLGESRNMIENQDCRYRTSGVCVVVIKSIFFQGKNQGWCDI